EHAWKQLEWSAVERARAVGFACRLDRQLEAVAAAADRPETRLAQRLRAELQAAVTGGPGGPSPGTAALVSAVGEVHEPAASLPELTLAARVRELLRALFDQEWNENVVVAAVSKPRWPVGPEAAAGSPDRPVTVMPRADMRNPLMWPLIAVQGASVAG